MSTLWLRLRWSWRDLRARWLQVAAIALVIGIGSGLYSGLSSVSEWRRESYPASYDELGMWDLRFEGSEGTFVDEDGLAAVVDEFFAEGDIDGATARLVVPVQVDASSDDEVVLVPGRVMGTPVGEGEPTLSRTHVFEGRELGPQDAGQPVALIHELFASDHRLEPPTTIKLSGDREVEVVGTATAPEDFFVLGDGLNFFADFAVLWMPLDSTQELAGRPGAVNDLVVTVADGADRDAVEADLSAALVDAFPDAGFTVVHQEDDRVLRLLFDDIDGDQRLYNIFALIILGGAAFAAFNLTGRVVEAQRREIGIGMAMGVPRAQIAIRPLLFGAQVALVGVMFGVGVGLLVDMGMASLLRSFQPLPSWQTSFQSGVFLRGAALGLALPFVATLLPVWRAVRVSPVDAIRTNRSPTSGMVGVLKRIPLPGNSVGEMPVRNVLRTPRRTLLTALGIAAAIATLVGVLGMIDSFLETVDRGDAEILGAEPDRLTVDLDGAYAPDSDEVSSILDAPEVGTADTGLTVGGILDPSGEQIEVLLTTVPFDSRLWQPSVVDGELSRDEPGIVLARKAARDLGVEPGDTVELIYARFGEGLDTVELPVLAVNPNPYRFAAFMDTKYQDLIDPQGRVNHLQVLPAPDASVGDVQRALFSLDGVATVEPVSATADAIRDQLEETVGFFTILQVGLLVLALLIAFNSTAINMDERARENATMFAFGLPVRSVMRIAITESVLTGLLGTLIGLALGRLLLEWLIRVLLPSTLPDLEIVAYVSTSTIVTAFLLGVVAVAAAPLLTVRRLRRMDIPSTLRVME